MRFDMNLRRKIISGYVPVIFLLLLIIALSVIQFRLVGEQVEHLTQSVAGDVRTVNSIAAEILSMRTSVEKYIYGENPEDKKEAEQHIQQLQQLLQLAKSQLSDAGRQKIFGEIAETAHEYIDKFNKFSIRIQARDENKKKIFSDGQAIQSKLHKAISELQEKLIDAGGKEKNTAEAGRQLSMALAALKKFTDARDSVSRFLLGYDQQHVKNFLADIAAALEIMDGISIEELGGIRVDIEDFRDEVEGLAAVVAKMEGEVRKTILPLAPKIMELSRRATDSGWGEMDSSRSAVSAQIRGTNTTIQLIGLLAVCAALALGFVIAHYIIRPILTIMNGLTASAETVTVASGQVTNASQQLAQASAEQAASIEETSASLEEIATMTQSNMENADTCDKLMKEATRSVFQANATMTRLTSAMEEISGSSRETSKIIKSIDEIAFQTNLLALNAAVEAARAGEAGRGFAVVAEEVRGLAARSAEAARSTGELIAATVQRIQEGADLVLSTSHAFEMVSESVQKSEALFRDIFASSRQQSEGIDQINRAVSQMDKVVQGNSASAEESASAAIEMKTQAGEMKHYISLLDLQVRGGSRQALPPPSWQPAEAMPAPIKRQRELSRKNI